MFQHILLVTDLSAVSEHAFEVATALARVQAARLSVLHVYVVSPETLASAPDEESECTWPGVVRARQILERLVAGLRATGLRADGIVRIGDATTRILEVARERDFDLVVTGTHGRKGLARLWKGSVAEEVLRGSGTPVLVVPTDADQVIAVPSCGANARSRVPGPRRGPEPADEPRPTGDVAPVEAVPSARGPARLTLVR
jgi:nucleotide-binding universal stress UspA family protein